MGLRPLVRYLRFSPFDTATPEGRAHERYRLAFLSMAANLLSRIASMALILFGVGLTLPYLGAERFGVWMTISGFVGMLTFLDLGVGNALTNRVAQAAARENPEELPQVISGGLALLALLAVGIGVLLSLLARVIPWDSLIKVANPDTRTETETALKIFALLFAANLFTGGINRVFAGLQRAFEAHLFSILGTLLSLLLLWLASRQQADIAHLLAATLGGQSLASLGLLAILYRRGQLTFRDLSRNPGSGTLLHDGSLFFLIQVGTMAAWGADNLIIASTLGAAQVAVFGVTQRLFQLVSQPLAIVNAPLWAAYADAHSRHETSFIRKTLARSLLLSFFLGLLGSAILLFTGDGLVSLWTRGTIVVPSTLLAAFAAWTVIEATANAFAVFTNGCNILRAQAFGVVSLILVAIPVKIHLAAEYGIAAMLIGFTTIFLINIAFWFGFRFKDQIHAALGRG
ncbi:MAG: flippase [Magnetococcales bacterium]|nr:flippase [Magnetococcales bacterium]